MLALRLLRFLIALEFQFQYPVDVVRVKSFVFTSEDPTIINLNFLSTLAMYGVVYVSLNGKRSGKERMGCYGHVP